MTVTVKGRDALRRHLLQEVPAQIKTVLRGAAKAGAAVIRDEAKQLCESDRVRAKIKVKGGKDDDANATATVYISGFWERTIANWLERGTSAHYISVDDEQRGGRTAARINRLGKAGVLVINGQPVGTTVLHPGARPHPFMRPAMDTRERDAIAAAQAYVDGRRGGDDDD